MMKSTIGLFIATGTSDNLICIFINELDKFDFKNDKISILIEYATWTIGVVCPWNWNINHD